MASSVRLFSVTVLTALTALAPTLMPVPALATASADGPGYCLALRGNGESEPAHWGALANVVEKLGLPKAQSGGSSATISLFLLENIAAQADVANAKDASSQRARAALWLKSLSGAANYLIQRPQAQATLSYYRSLSSGSRADLLKKLLAVRDGGAGLAEVKKLVADLHTFGIGDSTRYKFLLDYAANPGMRMITDYNRARFYLEDLITAIRVVGAFDAESDPALFFRDGLINFERVALAVGRIAGFYSNVTKNSEITSLQTKLVELCEPLQSGRSWREIATAEPRCQLLLEQALTAHFAQPEKIDAANPALKPVGAVIPSYPTTAVLTGAAYQNAKSIYEKYHRDLDRSAATTFKIEDARDVRFGYWGETSVLAKIERDLKSSFIDGLGRSFDFTADAKSARFLALGPARWIDVLRYSPAEPGLQSLQLMKVAGQEAYSAGGWSDLHPVPVLRASGCEHVVYVTRKGGESLFGQGVAKRVLNLDRDWKFLRTSDQATLLSVRTLNNSGDPDDLASAWSQLYNLANPKSSLSTSIASADAVLCTDWDRFDVKSQLAEMVDESLTAPFIARDESLARVLTEAGAKLVDQPTAANWAGCVAR